MRSTVQRTHCLQTARTFSTCAVACPAAPTRVAAQLCVGTAASPRSAKRSAALPPEGVPACERWARRRREGTRAQEKMVAAGKQPPPPPQSMRRSLLLLVVVLLPGCAATAPPGYAPLSTTVCSAAGAAALTAGGVPAASGGSSVMPALPRRDRTGASISSDLGTYTIVNCGAGAGSGALPCALAPLPPVSSLATAAGAPNTVIQYAEGPLLYGILALLMAILVVLFIIVFVIARYCCCCCCRADTCIGGFCTCGGAEPSRRSCGCGAVAVPARGKAGDSDVASAAGVTAAGSPQELVYPRAERWLTGILLAIFLCFITAFAIIGAVAGLTALPASVSQAAPVVTAAFTPWTSSLLDSVQALLVSVGSAVVAPNLLALNTTVQSAVNLPVTASLLATIASSIDSLPTAADVDAAVTSANGSSTTLLSSVATVTGNISALLANRALMVSGLSGLSASVSSLNTSLVSLGAAVEGVNTSLTPLASCRATALDELNALMPAVSSMACAGTAPASCAPSASSLYMAACGSGVGCTGAGQVPTAASVGGIATAFATVCTSAPCGYRNVGGFNTVDLTPIQQNLTALQAVLSTSLATVNFTAAGAALSSLPATRACLTNTALPNVAAALATAQAALDALPSAPALVGQINSLTATTNAIDDNFASVGAALVGVDAVLSTLLPPLLALSEALANVLTLRNIGIAAEFATAQLDSINASLVQLPASVSASLNTLSSLNDTIANALSSVSVANTSLAAALAQVASTDTAAFLTLTAGYATSFRTAYASVNTTAAIATVNQLNSVSANFTAVNASLNSLSASLAGAAVDTALATNLTALEAQVAALQSDMAVMLLDLAAIAGDGTFTCAAAPHAPCTADSNCSTYCRPGQSNSARLASELLALGMTVASPAWAAAQSALAPINSAAASVDIGGASSMLNSAAAAVAAVSLGSTAATLASATTVASGIDVSSVSSALATVTAQLNGVSFASFAPSISAATATLATAQTTWLPLVNGASALVDELVYQLNVGLAAYSTALSASSLNAVGNTQGLGNLVTALINPLQLMYNGLARSPQTIFSLPVLRINETVPTDTLNRYTASGPLLPNRNLGFVDFVLYASNLINVVPAADSTRATVQASSSGSAYPGGALCLTDACLAATVSAYSSQTIAQTTATVAPFTVPINLSFIGLVNLIWLLPAIILLLGVCAAASPWLCRRCCTPAASPRWEKCAYGWLAGCVLCQLPFLFVLAALLFPATMVMGDACASWRNVAYNAALQADSSGTCVYGTPVPGSPGLCAIDASVSLPWGPLRVSGTISVAQTVAAVLGGSCSGGTAPWAPLVASAAAAVDTLPLAALNYYLEGPAALVTVQPPLLATLRAFAVSAGATVSAFLTRVADSQLSCPAVSSLAAAASDAVCCTVYTPLYWYASVIFLLAWAYCLCGLPAALLGRKRLVSRPWGAAAAKVGAGAGVGAAAADSRALAFAAPAQPPGLDADGVDAEAAGGGDISPETRKSVVVAVGAAGTFTHPGAPSPSHVPPPPLQSPTAAYPPLPAHAATSAAYPTAGGSSAAPLPAAPSGLEYYRSPNARASVRAVPVAAAGVAAGAAVAAAGARRNSAASAASASSAASAARRAPPPDAPMSPAVAAALAAVASASAVVAGSRAGSTNSSRRSSRASAPPDDDEDDPSPAPPPEPHRRDSIEQHRRVDAFALPRVASASANVRGTHGGYAAPDLDIDGGRF